MIPTFIAPSVGGQGVDDPLARRARRRTARAARPAADRARARRPRRRASRSTSVFQPALDGLDPLGRRPHRHARRARAGTPPSAARRSRSGPRGRCGPAPACRGSRAAASARSPGIASTRAEQLGAASSRARVRGWSGSTAGSGSASRIATSRSSRSGTSTLPARCAVTSTYSPGSTPRSASARRPLLARAARTAASRRPSRRRRARPARRPTRCAGCHRRLRRAQQQVARVVGEHAVQLLGHRAVERAHARLDVRDGHARAAPPRAPPRASSWCRRRPAPCRAACRASSGSRAASIRAVWSVFVPSWIAELAVRRRDAQLVEEDPRQLVVVVLPRVDEQLLVPLAQWQRHGGCLHELRAVSDDGDDSHDVASRQSGRRGTMMAMGAARKLVGGAVGPGGGRGEARGLVPALPARRRDARRRPRR